MFAIRRHELRIRFPRDRILWHPHPTIGIMKSMFAIRRHELRIRFPRDRILWFMGLGLSNTNKVMVWQSGYHTARVIQIRPLIVSLARVIRIHHGHRSVNHKQSDSLTCGYHTARAIQIRPLIVSPARVIRIRPIKKSPARVTPPLAPHPTIGIMKFTFAVRRHELRIRFPRDRILWHPPHPTIGIMKSMFAIRRHELRIRFPRDRIRWHPTLP